MVWDELPSLWAEFLLPPFYPGSGYDTFAFAAMFKSVALSIIELSYLVKPSHFNMSMSVKTVRHLSNKIFDNAEFLMTMHECEEQLSHFLVFS